MAFENNPTSLIPTGISGVTTEKFSQAPPQQEPSYSDTLKGRLDADLSLASAATTGTLGQLAGTAQGIGTEAINTIRGKGPGFGSGYAENLAEKYSSALTRTPKTAEGQRELGKAADTLSNLVPLAGIAPELNVIAKTAGPSMGQVGRAITSTSGIKQTPLRTAGRAIIHPVKAVQEYITNLKDDNLARQTALENRIGDERAAGYRLIGNEAVKDRRLSALVNEAERQGISKKEAAAIHVASNADKNEMQSMFISC